MYKILTVCHSHFTTHCTIFPTIHMTILMLYHLGLIGEQFVA